MLVPVGFCLLCLNHQEFRMSHPCWSVTNVVTHDVNANHLWLNSWVNFLYSTLWIFNRIWSLFGRYESWYYSGLTPCITYIKITVLEEAYCQSFLKERLNITYLTQCSTQHHWIKTYSVYNIKYIGNTGRETLTK